MEEVVEVLKIDDVNLAMLEEIDVITTMVDDALLLACIGLVEVLTMNVVDCTVDATREVLKKDDNILWLKTSGVLIVEISVLEFAMDGVNKRDNLDVADTIEEVMDIGLVE